MTPVTQWTTLVVWEFSSFNLEVQSGRTVWAAVLAADAEPLCVSLDILVVELDPERPAQVGLPHRVLQSPPGIGEPVGDLRERERERKEGEIEANRSRCYCLDSTHLHVRRKRLALCLPSVSLGGNRKRGWGKRQKQSRVAERLPGTALRNIPDAPERHPSMHLFCVNAM